MKKFFVFLFFFLFSTPVLADSFTIELDNRAGKWNPRLMLFLNPVSDLMVEFRKGPGGNHLQGLLGWNFVLSKGVVISPYLGLGFADNKELEPIYFQPELLFSVLRNDFKFGFCFSYAEKIEKDYPNMIYFQLSGDYLAKLVLYGIKTDLLLFPEKDKKMVFWRIGPNVGYKIMEKTIFSFWPNWEYESASFGVRFGTTVNF